MNVLKSSDSKFFSNENKTEIQELRDDLYSDKKDRKRDAMKKIIASMTIGKDVSILFQDVLNCMHIDNIEIKKLIYLYLTNYASSFPDACLMALNSFTKDSNDPNPLVRALAIRTIGYIRVEKMVEHITSPLKKALKDSDSYVRKTAALSVAKIHSINQKVVEEHGLVDLLIELLSDSNAVVVSNATAALTEISMSNKNALFFKRFPNTVNKLLNALNECSEWGQISILESLINYDPIDGNEAKSICERLTPRLSHANSAVVLTTVRILLKLIPMQNTQSDFVKSLEKKITPHLVTLLSSEPEIQLVALKNINLIVQRIPDLFKNEFGVFFVKYNDPIYIKLEKLDILIRLTNSANISHVLNELKEYSTEVDVDFVRKSVRAIGRCAIKVEESADKCVETLLELIKSKINGNQDFKENYVLQEAIVVIRDIFRKYPNKYEAIISELCDNLDSLSEPEARAALIWIIGEYSDRIDNADEILEQFMNGFQDENTQVQLQLLTAIVKLFLKKPENSKDLVQNMLNLVTQQTDNPDLRDRGYIYWRLLTTNPENAASIILAEKPLISSETDLIEPSLLNELILNLSTVATIYQKPPEAFVQTKYQHYKTNLINNKSTVNNDVVFQSKEDVIVDLLDFGIDEGLPVQVPVLLPSYNTQLDFLGDGIENLIGDLNIQPEQKVELSIPSQSSDFLSSLSNFSTFLKTIDNIPKQLWLEPRKGKGLEIEGTFSRKNGQIFMEIDFYNKALITMNNFAIQFNKNSFGLSLVDNIPMGLVLQPNQTTHISVLLSTDGVVCKMDPLNSLQVALRNNIDVFYFIANIPIQVLFSEENKIEKMDFLKNWKEIPEVNEQKAKISLWKRISIDSTELVEILKNNNLNIVNINNIDGLEIILQAIKLINNIWIYIETKLDTQKNSLEVIKHFISQLHEICDNFILNIKLSIKSRYTEVNQIIKDFYEIIINE